MILFRSQQISLLDQFGITEEGIQRSVQMSLKEMKMVGCPVATEELTSSIVKEAMVWMNAHLAKFTKTASSEPESKALRDVFNTEELVEKISLKLEGQKSAEDARQSLLCWKTCSAVCPSEEDIDSTLSSAVGNSMTLIIDTIESSLDEQDEEACMNKPAKRLLSTIRQAVKAFACQSTSLSEVSFYDEDLQGDHRECVSQLTLGSQIPVFEPTKAFSFDDFRLKVSKAVSSVLIIKMRDFGSLPSSYMHICATDIPTSVEVPRGEMEPSFEPYRKPVEEAASMVIETFVEEMKAIVQSAECVNEKEETLVETSPDDVSSTKNVTPDAEKNPALLAAKKIFGKVQKALGDFYMQLPSKLYQAISALSSDDAAEQTPPESEDVPIQDFMQTASSRHGQLPQVMTVSHGQLHPTEREATRPVQIFLSQPQLDTCTRNVLKGIITSYQEEKEASEPEETLFDPSATSSDYVRNVISQLSDMTSFSVDSHSLSATCIQHLSSTTFQRNAFDAVVDVLVASVESNNTLMSYVSNDSTEVLVMPKNDVCSSIPLEAELRDANVAASDIVDQFERDLQKCIESLQSLSISNQTGSPDGEGTISDITLLGSVTRTQKIPKRELISAASKLYQSVQVKVREFFIGLSFQRKHRYMRLEEMPSKDNMSDLSTDNPALSDPLDMTGEILVPADVEDCTKEVMGELLMAVKQHISEDQTNGTDEKISAGCYLAGNIMLEIENNFVCAFNPISSTDNRDSAELVAPTTEIIQKLSNEDIQAKSIKQVSQVLLKSAKSGGTLSSLPAESTASELVGTVVEGIQTLLQSTSYDAMDKTISDIKGDCEEGSAVLLAESKAQIDDFKVKVWSATREIFGNLQSKVKEFFTKSQLHGSKVEEKLCAKEAISNVLICIQEEVPNSGLWEHDSEYLHMFHDTVNSMLQSLGAIDVQRPTSASTSERSKTPLTNISLDDTSEDECLAGITRNTMADVVKTILENVDPGDASLSHAQGLTSVARRLERSLSRSSVSSSSHDLIDQIYGLFMRSTTPRQCVSDTMLMNHQQRVESGMPTASEILQLYIEESVKHLFLPCFKLPSPWSVAKGGVQQQTLTSISCPSSLTDVAVQGKMAAAKSPSQILSNTVTLVIDMMVKEVMLSLTRSLSPSDNLETIGETSHAFSEGPNENQMNAETTADFKIIQWPEAFPLATDDYSGLVTLLVIQLMAKINNQSFSDNMASKARELINKVVAALCASSGISVTESYPKHTKVHRIYRSVFTDLLNQFGSKMVLLEAMESNHPSFETSMVTSLTKEILQISIKEPVDGADEPSVPLSANIFTTGSDDPLTDKSPALTERSREDSRNPKKHFIKIFSVLRGRHLS